MRGPLERLVRSWWAGGGGRAGGLLRTATAPLEATYRAAVARRNRRWDRRGGTRVEGVRVISVGNVTVGGTGKTPVTRWIARLLADRGLPVAVLARGYGRDEILLHRRWNPDVAVVAGADRVEGGRKAREAGARVLVLDDGFQHRRIHRDLDLVLVAAEDPRPARLLPRGPYREPVDALRRADVVVVTRRTAEPAVQDALVARLEERFPGTLLAAAALEPGGFETLAGAPAEPPPGPLLVATAVARPGAVEAHVRAATGADVRLLAYPDHHDFTDRDVAELAARASGRTLVVTEKDAVKLLPHAAALGPGVRVVTLRLAWSRGEEAVIRRILDAAAGPGPADAAGPDPQATQAAGSPRAVSGTREG